MTSERAVPAPVRRGVPLWFRIALTVLVTFLVATAAAGTYLGMALHRMGVRTVETHIDTDLALLAPPVRSALVRGDRADLTALAAAAKQRGDVRLTVILPGGEVVAESDRPLPLANHLDRPEVRAAKARRSAAAPRSRTTFSTSRGDSTVPTAGRSACCGSRARSAWSPRSTASSTGSWGSRPCWACPWRRSWVGSRRAGSRARSRR